MCQNLAALLCSSPWAKVHFESSPPSVARTPLPFASFKMEILVDIAFLGSTLSQLINSINLKVAAVLWAQPRGQRPRKSYIGAGTGDKVTDVPLASDVTQRCRI